MQDAGSGGPTLGTLEESVRMKTSSLDCKDAGLYKKDKLSSLMKFHLSPHVL